MSKVLGTIAAVLLAAAAFVAFKNKQAYEAEIATNKKSIRLETTTKKDLAEEQLRFTTAETEKKEKEELNTKVQTELAEVTTQFEAAQKKVDSLKAEHGNNQTEIASADEILKGLPDPDELVPKIKRMQTEKSAAQGEIDTLNTTLANLVQRDKNAQGRIATTRKLIELQSTGKSFPSLRTSISSVYRNWGFVILSAGDSQGVVSGSILDVLRGGEVIGKLKVTAVEAGRSSADIVLDSVAEGTTLQAGDSVVAEREEVKPPVAAASR